MSHWKSAVKAALRPLVPARLLELRRRQQFEADQRADRDRPLDEVFTEIYEKGAWLKTDGIRYHSGPGSEPAVTAGYEDFVVALIERRKNIATLVDVGCGDFQVSQRILARLSRPVRYIGCDIAANVVAYNTETYGKPGQIEFRHGDASRDNLPSGDIVTVREVFQHLSNSTIHAALTNLRNAFREAIITECLFTKPSAPNLDIISGYRTRDGLKSGVYLDLPPFNLEVFDRYDYSVNDEEFIRTSCVRL